MPSKVLAIGEIMLEMADVEEDLYKRSFAGDTFNVAHYLNVVSGGDIRADYLTALGDDAQSRECLDYMERHGVSTARCLADPARTLGLFILSNDPSGEKQYGYWRGQSAARHLFDRLQNLSGYELVYLSGITAAVTEKKENLLTCIEAAKQDGATVAFDYNHRALLWSPEDACAFAAKILELADLVKISDEELDVLYPDRDLADLSREAPNAEWVLTCGGEKGEIWRAGECLFRQDFEAVPKVVDSSAAGDSFMAAYIAVRLSGKGAAEGLALGHSVASQVVCGKGSIVPIDRTKL